MTRMELGCGSERRLAVLHADSRMASRARSCMQPEPEPERADIPSRGSSLGLICTAPALISKRDSRSATSIVDASGVWIGETQGRFRVRARLTRPLGGTYCAWGTDTVAVAGTAPIARGRR